jgi:hypothetical protein
MSSDFAKELLIQINKVRKFPRSYVPFLEDHLEHFKGNVLYLTNEGLQTEEGPKAYKEAI